MASVRKLKSKGKALAHLMDYDLRPGGGFFLHTPDYYLRKQAFDSLPPAKCVRPMRHVKAWTQRAAQDLEDKQLAVLRTNPQTDWQQLEQACQTERSVLLGRLQVLGMARAWAKAGNGWGVQRVAQRVTGVH